MFDLLKGDSPTPRVQALLKRLASGQAKHNFDIVGMQCDRTQQVLSDTPTRFGELVDVEAVLPDGWHIGYVEALPRRSLWRLSPGDI